MTDTRIVFTSGDIIGSGSLTQFYPGKLTEMDLKKGSFFCFPKVSYCGYVTKYTSDSVIVTLDKSFGRPDDIIEKDVILNYVKTIDHFKTRQLVLGSYKVGKETTMISPFGYRGDSQLSDASFLPDEFLDKGFPLHRIDKAQDLAKVLYEIDLNRPTPNVCVGYREEGEPGTLFTFNGYTWNNIIQLFSAKILAGLPQRGKNPLSARGFSTFCLFNLRASTGDKKFLESFSSAHPSAFLSSISLRPSAELMYDSLKVDAFNKIVWGSMGAEHLEDETVVDVNGKVIEEYEEDIYDIVLQKERKIPLTLLLEMESIDIAEGLEQLVEIKGFQAYPVEVNMPKIELQSIVLGVSDITSVELRYATNREVKDGYIAAMNFFVTLDLTHDMITKIESELEDLFKSTMNVSIITGDYDA